MSTVGEREKRTQERVLRLFRDVLRYDYLGDWTHRVENRNIEGSLLRDWLKGRGVSDALISRALYELEKAAAIGEGRSLYDANRAVYDLLRYGVKVKDEAGEQKQTVWLVDWENPEANHFAVAEEVTIKGDLTKRPDVVLYVNGIAVGVIELKRSTVSVSEGIRQNLANQNKTFIRGFFSTIQLVLAANETEGLRYATIETPEKYFLNWQESGGTGGFLEQHLTQLCRKDRLLEVTHDFMVFDAGTKKTCRHNQYFAVRAAQEHVGRRAGGIIWNTQGSGKSLIMVWLAKWIRENVEGSRVLIITDRTELDEQIEKVFLGVNEEICRTTSGADLLGQLASTDPWLLCSLVHKFGRSDDAAAAAFIEEIKKNVGADFKPQGEFFVFVDECHRTQSGTLHEAMKSILPGATFIGFTGTPLLKKDKKRSIEVFGPYIHTYKFDEAVRDGVVLDLRYEARDIDQMLSSPEKVDLWFEAKTYGLSDVARAKIKQKWGTMQKVLSARSRMEVIVQDILFDMETRDRLMSGRGNAILVTASIYQACKLFEMLSKTHLNGKCAIVTSYRPGADDIKGEESGEGLTERADQFEIYREMLADYFGVPEAQAVNRVEEFEKKVKEKFIKEPGQMKLLIVVDKLLTGFDAPPASYLYIDKHMQDHSLFQAVCRVNRLDGEDKEYGYIIDYKDLFKSVQSAIRDYTSGALDGYDEGDVKGLLTDRFEKGHERLEEAREVVKAICDPVAPPKSTEDYLHFFCAEIPGDKHQLKDNEPKRVALYKAVSSLVRAYASIANEMADAGYSEQEAQAIREEVVYFEKVREEVKVASGDYVDMKMYEPAMRHLLDSYVRASDSAVISAFDDTGLVELLANQGEDALIKAVPEGIRKSKEAMAETIENNIRRVIIDEQPVNPRYFEKMSALLDTLIKERKTQALEYKAYLQRLVDLAKKVKEPAATTAYPSTLNTTALRALYDNLDQDEALALRIDTAVRYTREDAWRGNRFKERKLRYAIARELGADDDRVDEILELVKSQREY